MHLKKILATFCAVGTFVAATGVMASDSNLRSADDLLNKFSRNGVSGNELERLDENYRRDMFDRDDRDFHFDDFDDDFRPRRFRKKVVCKARNFRGDRFKAFGFHPRRVQRRALRRCRYNSWVPRSCRPLGCKKIRRHGPRGPRGPRF